MGRVDQRVSKALIGWLAFVAIFSALKYLGHSCPSPPADVAYRWESSIGALIQFGVIFAIALVIARGRNIRNSSRCARRRSGAVAATISIAVIVVILLIAQALSPFADPEAEQGLIPTYWDSGRIAQFVAFAFAVIIVGPIIEELMFQGVGFSLLEPFRPVDSGGRFRRGFRPRARAPRRLDHPPSESAWPISAAGPRASTPACCSTRPSTQRG